MLAELRDPAFCFVLVVGIYRRPQIVAQLRDYLIGLTDCEMDLRENEAGIGECVLTLAQHLDGFRGDVALGNDSARQKIA